MYRNNIFKIFDFKNIIRCLKNVYFSQTGRKIKITYLEIGFIILQLTAFFELKKTNF